MWEDNVIDFDKLEGGNVAYVGNFLDCFATVITKK